MNIDKKSLFFLLISLVILASSCSSSRSYADRKRSKYSKSTYVNTTKKTSRSTTRKTRTRTTSKSKPANSTGVRALIVDNAKKYMGSKYVYGGKKPGGFDCSGFTSYVFNQSGVTLTGPSHSQSKQGRQVSIQNLKTGDLVFFGKHGKVSHVGIVAESYNNVLKVIHSTSSRGVVLEDIKNSDYWMSRFLYGRDVIGHSYVSN